MAGKPSVPNTVSASLDYELAVILATHVEESDEYESKADFLREALWEKLRDDVGSTDVLDHYIQIQEEKVRQLKAKKSGVEQRLRTESERLEAMQEERVETAEAEADEFFEQLSDAEPDTR